MRGPEDCWPWTKGKQNGYGRMSVGGRTTRVHRIAYVLAHGAIPENLTIDHVRARGCVRRDCCNPAHLEAVTRGVNTLRGDGPPALNARRDVCGKGHEFTPENTLRTANGRWCRTCKRENEQADYWADGHEPYRGSGDRCKRGHLLTPDNIRSGTRRSCRTCWRDRDRERWHERQSVTSRP